MAISWGAEIDLVDDGAMSRGGVGILRRKTVANTACFALCCNEIATLSHRYEAAGSGPWLSETRSWYGTTPVLAARAQARA